jgi:hypothetical protein
MDMPCGIGGRRSFSFRPLNGLLEADVAEAARAPTRPEAIAAVLAASLARIGDAPVDADLIATLPAGDARFLMSRLARHFGCDQRWITADCASCGKPFDFPVALGDLPAAQGDGGTGTVPTSIGPVTVRPPTCADQIAIARARGGDRASLLLQRCITPSDLSGLSDGDLLAIDAAIAARSPSIPAGASAQCPDCGHGNAVPVSASDWLADLGDGPLEDVHVIASAYGWHEADILALPRAKRAAYLRFIERSRGMSSGEA